MLPALKVAPCVKQFAQILTNFVSTCFWRRRLQSRVRALLSVLAHKSLTNIKMGWPISSATPSNANYPTLYEDKVHLVEKTNSYVIFLAENNVGQDAL